jgi:hypothetical protein
MAEPAGGSNDEERGQSAVPIERLWRAPRPGSPFCSAILPCVMSYAHGIMFTESWGRRNGAAICSFLRSAPCAALRLTSFVSDVGFPKISL